MTILTGIEVGGWFVQEHARGFTKQTADGFMYQEFDDGGYAYVWVMSMVDFDMNVYFLLDVRTKPDGDAEETRDFLFVGCGVGIKSFEACWQNEPIGFHAPIEDHMSRFARGMRWFSDQIEVSREDMFSRLSEADAGDAK